MKKGDMNTSKFRKELSKIMPGYSWTVHHQFISKISLSATGIQSAGCNRLSTLEIARVERGGVVKYVAKSSGYGRRAPWLGTSEAPTLAQALRELQKHYESVASNYASHAGYLRCARPKRKT